MAHQSSSDTDADGAPPALVGVHLILTYALLIGGIDSVGSTRVVRGPAGRYSGAGDGGYAWRRDLEPHVVARLSMGLVTLSLMLAILGEVRCSPCRCLDAVLRSVDARTGGMGDASCACGRDTFDGP